MHDRRRHVSALVYATLVVATLAIASTGYGEPGVLRICVFSSDPPALTTFHPAFDPDSSTLITQIFDSLIHLDLDGKFVPGLATSWEQVSPTVYRFKLREGVRFHNGEPFTAESVKFTYDTVLDPKVGSGTAWILNTIKKVTVINDYEVEIETSDPDGMFLYRFSMFGSVAPVKYCQEKGLKYFEEHPIGTGPFRFVKWDKGQQIVMEANEDYWAPGIPKTKQLIYRIIPRDQWTRALKNGEVDLVPDLSGKDTRDIAKERGLKVMKRLVLADYWVLLADRGPLASLEVRKALNYAVDKDALVKYADFGNAVPATSVGKKGEFGSNPDIKPYPYDPKKARQLLAEAGYPDGFTLRALAADTSADVAKIIKANLADVGVKVDLEIVTRPQWTQTIIVGKVTGNPWDGDMAINLVDNPIVDMAFHAGLFLSSASPWSMMNNAEYDQKYLAALKVSDAQEHERRLQELDKYIYDNAFMLFTTQRIRTMGMGQNVEIPKVGINGHVDYFMLSEAVVK